MSSRGRDDGIYEFGEYRLDPVRRVLSGLGGEPVALKPKVLDTLVVLVEHAGKVVDKPTLMAAVWPNLVVEENNLNKNVSALRQTLGETPEDHRFIVTEPGRGYRFVATVRRVPRTADCEPSAGGLEAHSTAAPGSAAPAAASTGASEAVDSGRRPPGPRVAQGSSPPSPC